MWKKSLALVAINNAIETKTQFDWLNVWFVYKFHIKLTLGKNIAHIFESIWHKTCRSITFQVECGHNNKISFKVLSKLRKRNCIR